MPVELVRSAKSRTLRHVLVFVLFVLTGIVGRKAIVDSFSTPLPFNDFGTIHLGTLCLFERCDPYAHDDLMALSVAHGEPVLNVPSPLVYPPSALLLLTPLAYVGWPTAGILWSGLSVLAMELVCFLLVERFGLKRFSVALLPLLAVILGTSFFDSLRLGNPAVMAASLLTVACMLMMAREEDRGGWRPLMGALLLGLVLALKPQLAVGPLLVCLLYRPTRSGAVKAVILAAGLLVAGTLAYRVRLGSFEFLHSLLLSRQQFLPGGTADPSGLNPRAHTFLGLQAIGAALRSSGPWPAVCAWGATVLLAGVTLWRRPLPRFPWSTIALVTLLSLFPVYHRKYDRMILLLLIPAIVELSVAGYRWLVVALACSIALWQATDQIFAVVLPGMTKLPLSAILELVVFGWLLCGVWRSRGRDFVRI